MLQTCLAHSKATALVRHGTAAIGWCRLMSRRHDWLGVLLGGRVVPAIKELRVKVPIQGQVHVITVVHPVVIVKVRDWLLMDGTL